MEFLSIALLALGFAGFIWRTGDAYDESAMRHADERKAPSYARTAESVLGSANFESGSSDDCEMIDGLTAQAAFGQHSDEN